MTDRRITKHTPGPWSIENDNGDSPEAMGPCLCVTTDTSHIAFVFDDAPANARLIAAAPDLLEIVSSLDKVFTGKHSPHPFQIWESNGNIVTTWHDAVKAAIVKAKGA